MRIPPLKVPDLGDCGPATSPIEYRAAKAAIAHSFGEKPESAAGSEMFGQRKLR